MYMDENIIIRFKGIETSEQMNVQVRRLMELLINEAPSESLIKALLVNTGERGFSGMIRVNTTEGSFFAKARDESLTGLTHKLVEKVRRQIVNWKNVRFYIPEDEDKAYQGESVAE